MHRLILCLLLLPIVSCASYNHTNILADSNNENYGKYMRYGSDGFTGSYTNPEPTISMSNHFFLLGYFQTKDIDALKMCKEKGFNKVNLVINEKRWYDGVLTAITLGIYAPTSTYIWCE